METAANNNSSNTNNSAPAAPGNPLAIQITDKAVKEIKRIIATDPEASGLKPSRDGCRWRMLGDELQIGIRQRSD